MKLYSYKNCSSCRQAVKWLRAAGIAFEERSIRETPPDPAELRAMLELSGGEVRALFNTSGQEYRALGLKDRLPGMTVEEALQLLAGNGHLVKRPFLIDALRGIGLAGFREEVWRACLG